VASAVVVSQRVGAGRAAVWEALLRPSAGDERTASDVVTLAGAGVVARLDLVDPVDGFTGTATWAGVPHRVTVHLVDQGDDGTLVVLTADEDRTVVAEGTATGGGRSALAQRRALRDLRRLAGHVARRAQPETVGGA
jgi:hypothetical protein